MSSLTHTYIEYDMGDFIIVVKRNRKTMRRSKKFWRTLNTLSFTVSHPLPHGIILINNI